jgi:hypothetical protein
VKNIKGASANIMGDKTFYDTFVASYPEYSHLNPAMLNSAGALPRNMSLNFDEFCRELKGKRNNAEKSVLFLYYTLIRNINK